MKRGTWHMAAVRVITETLDRFPPDAPPARVILALRRAYPFCERRYWPYKVWLREQRRALHRRFPELMRELDRINRRNRRAPSIEHADAPNQLPLFEETPCLSKCN